VDANDLLLSGGVPAAKFETIGTVVKGVIVAADVTQQTDISTGQPKNWPDGNPMMQVVVTLQTDQRDANVDDDDGTRRLFVRGQMQAAVRDALRKAGAKLEVGGTLAVQYEADEPAKQRGFNPKKLYRAEYAAPLPGTEAANGLLGGAVAANVPATGVAASSLI
jgi:hypothetical protein